MTVDSPQRAGIYCRLSYAPDGSEEKVERQEADCRSLAERLGWHVAEVYPDNSRSAWQRARKRPAWDAMLSAINDGRLDAIIVYHGDRLIRQPYDLERLIAIADTRGIRIASVSGTRDLDSPDDRFILRIEAAQACRESDNTSRRTRRGWEARAKQGLPPGGGRRPFGFLPDRVTRDEYEAEILGEAVKRVMAGQSTYGVVRWMNTVSTTTEGGLWTSRALKNVLRSPRVAGLVEHGGQPYEAVWEPIISRQTWEDLTALLRQRGTTNEHRSQERRYLLSGWAECVTCSSVVMTKPSGGRNRRNSRLYWCRNPECPKRMSRNTWHLDEYVTQRVLERLSDPALWDELAAPEPSVTPDITALERRRLEATEQLEHLADHPGVSIASLTRAIESFDRRIEELRAQRAASARERILARMAGVTRDQWDATPIDVRHAVVRSLFRVVILPATWRGPGFDPASVRLVPVGGDAETDDA